MIKVIILLSAIFTIFIFTQCCDDQARYYRAIKIHKILHGDGYGYETENSLNIDTGRIYRIDIEYNVEWFAMSSKLSEFFINNAKATQACDKKIPPKLLDTINKVEIVSDADFDSTHMKGTSFRDYFYLDQFNTLSNFPILTINDFQRLYLKKRPNIISKHSFFLTITMKSGLILSGKTATVHFL